MAEFEHQLAALGPWIHHYGVAAVFLILTFESLGIPVPGESLLVVAAVLAGRGEISLPGLIFSAWVGAVIGDNIGYLGGRMLGHRLVWRYGGKVGLTAERLNKIETTFARYGPVTVVFARFVNVLRQLNGVIAGTMQMEWWRFLTFNALGGALWVLAWVAAGFYLGSHGADIAVLVHKSGILGMFAFVVALIAGVGYFICRRLFVRPRGS